MYGKHFQSTYNGSMVGAGPTVFAVWGYVIAHTRDSMVELNPTILAAILGCPVTEIEQAITVLTSPDERSRSKEHDGRRLIRHTEFLYFVPTYEKYRNIRNEEERRKYMREYMRDYRSNNHTVSSCKQPLAHSEADSDSEADTSTTRHFSDEKSTPISKGEKNNIPYEEIINLYHEKLPELPRCIKLTNQRKGYIRQRWSEDLPDLESWGKYFDIVRQSKFLMGRSNGTDGRPPFRADLPWLCRPENAVKVIEGKYHRG